jgi:hypothetical protein
MENRVKKFAETKKYPKFFQKATGKEKKREGEGVCGAMCKQIFIYIACTLHHR